jgi:hypothetical protein
MRTSILQSALAVSLEDLSETTQEINPLTAETVIELDEVLEEVRESGEEVAGQEEAVDTLSDAVDSLESLVVALESAVKAGGMSPQTADTHSRAMAIALRHLPVDKASYTLSTESFGGTGDKLVASQEALEGAKELLAKLWNGIKTAVLNAWNAIKGFYERIGKSGPAVVAAGKSLKQKAAATKSIPDAGKFKVSSSAAVGLSVDGKFDPTKALANVVQGYEVGVKGYGARILTSLGPLIAVVESGQVSPQRLNEAAAKVDLNAALTEDMKGKLPGGYYFDLTLGEGMVSGGSDLSILSKSSLKLSRGKQTPPANSNVDHMTPADVSAMADKIIAIGNQLIASKAVMSMAEKGVNQIVKAGTKLAGQGGTLEKEELAGAKAVMGQLNKASRLLTGCGPQYLQYMGSTAKMAVQFGSAILGAKAAPVEAAPAA